MSEKLGFLDPVEAGRRGGARGGVARAANLSASDRQEAAAVAARARWTTPVATHAGTLQIGEIEIPCHVLEDGRRVLSQGGMIGSLGMSSGGNVRRPGSDRLARFVTGQTLRPFVDERLVTTIVQPIRFRPASGSAAVPGYEATVLADVCEAVLNARKSGVLQKQQTHIADQCELLMRGFARVGIIALVDEATGYQDDRERNALAQILEAFIAKELAAWVKTFPDDYYRELRRLRGLNSNLEEDEARPQFFGHLTNDVVYQRLAPGVLRELQAKNPRLDTGRRKSRHHQWLTRDLGHPKLGAHLHAVVTLMKISKNWHQFLAYLDATHPKYMATRAFPFVAQMLSEMPGGETDRMGA